MNFKTKALSFAIIFILAIVALAAMNKLEIVKAMIDSSTALTAAVTSLVAVFVGGYVEKKA